MTADLAAWLLADDGPIAEDERVARAAAGVGWSKNGVWDDWEDDVSDDDGGRLASTTFPETTTHIAAWDPARVLAECAAKRAIVTDCAEEIEAHDPDAFPDDLSHALARRTLLGLAQPYAGRPGWREEWRT